MDSARFTAATPVSLAPASGALLGVDLFLMSMMASCFDIDAVGMPRRSIWQNDCRDYRTLLQYDQSYFPSLPASASVAAWPPIDIDSRRFSINLEVTS